VRIAEDGEGEGAAAGGDEVAAEGADIAEGSSLGEDFAFERRLGEA
jgi:hypothetical protein